MNRHGDTSTELDRLLTEAPLAPDDPLAPTQSFIAEIYATFATVSPPQPRADLALVLDGRRVPDADADVVADLATARSSRRHRLAKRQPARVLVAATLMFVVATGGLAAAGTLPGPLQRAVAGVADHLGIDLPDGSPQQSDLPSGTTATASTLPTSPTTASEVPVTPPPPLSVTGGTSGTSTDPTTLPPTPSLPQITRPDGLPEPPDLTLPPPALLLPTSLPELFPGL